MKDSEGDVERGLRLQKLIREEFMKVDPDYETHQYDEQGELVYGPTATVLRSGPVFDYGIHGCGERHEEFKAAAIRAFDRFGRGEG